VEILFITHKYPPSVGGMQKQSFELISGTAEKCKVHKLVYDNRSGRLRFFLTLKSKVTKILKENPAISLIHLNDGLMAFAALPLRKITKLPILVTLHGLDIVLPSRFFQKHIVRRFKRYDGVIAVSRATADECLKRGFDKDKVFVVPNGVDTDLADIEKEQDYMEKLEKKLGISLDGKKILVSIGRPVYRKGFSWFMKSVMPKLTDDVVHLIIGPKQPKIEFIASVMKLLPRKLASNLTLLLGLGLDEVEINRALEENQLEERVFYLGKTPFKDMMQILRVSDLFVMPNIKVEGDAEGFGLVALEAAVCGVPVLASGIEGITDAIIDGKNGYLLPSGDADAWKDKIETVLSDLENLKIFGKAAKKYTIENYPWDKMTSGYISVFEKYHNFS